MEKDITIIGLLDRLKLIIDFSQLQIVDYWEADLCAIGLKDRNRLIYISTFNYLEEKELKYDFDFEILEKGKNQLMKVVKEGRSVSEKELIKEIKLFLSV